MADTRSPTTHQTDQSEADMFVDNLVSHTSINNHPRDTGKGNGHDGTLDEKDTRSSATDQADMFVENLVSHTSISKHLRDNGKTTDYDGTSNRRLDERDTRPSAMDQSGQIEADMFVDNFVSHTSLNNHPHDTGKGSGHDGTSNGRLDEKDTRKTHKKAKRWTMGILADEETDEVPGTVVLLSSSSIRNKPLGLEHESRGRSASTGTRTSTTSRRMRSHSAKKRTPDGQILLDPQPDDSANDPLNWPAWRRDCALLSLGFYCMVGGGMTPILAAGFNDVAKTYDVTYARVALTTGLYMMGLGVGSVIASPTAILFGKRPVYLVSAIMFVLTSVWCALAPSYEQLVVARVLQGISVSPVECLPSATIAEIFFLHERAFRVGIYTLLLLGGKNLVPLVSAAIIQAAGWRWVFWTVAIVVGATLFLLFLFVPETFWDRTPRARAITHRNRSRSLLRRSLPDVVKTIEVRKNSRSPSRSSKSRASSVPDLSRSTHEDTTGSTPKTPEKRMDGFVDVGLDGATPQSTPRSKPRMKLSDLPLHPVVSTTPTVYATPTKRAHFEEDENLPTLHNLNSPYYTTCESKMDYLNHHSVKKIQSDATQHDEEKANREPMPDMPTPETPIKHGDYDDMALPKVLRYTHNLRKAPPVPFHKTLKPWNGRLTHTNWFLVAFRPFVLYAYPSVLWSTLVYSLSVGWLIVLSESISEVYRNRETYNFTALGAGLVYISPFIGGVLGTAVAGKVSDILVRYMARKNGGIYEPEYRLVMAIPITITTAIGLMGFGWSAQERDRWIVPTIFFGIVSFGCALGSTTAITFCVDSYRQYAGEALVTLNFSKNILHGLVFSLFFPHWLQSDGSRDVFLAIGGIQIACMLTSIPMYIYGKRARMWTVRKGLMDRF